MTMRSGQSDFMKYYLRVGDFHIEIERKNIAMMIAVHIAQSGQNTETMISCEMTYPLKHIPPKASAERILASVRDLRIYPQSAISARRG